MNIIGYILTSIVTILIHLFIIQFKMMKKDQEQVLEAYKIKLGLKPTEIPYDKIKKEYDQKTKDYNSYEYKNVDYSLIEDEEGYDIDNDYDLFREDLLKYIEGQNNSYEHTNNLTPVANEPKNIKMNHNAINQPLYKKDNLMREQNLKLDSLDNQYKGSFNETIIPNIEQKTLKPENWTKKKEPIANGGMMGDIMGYEEESNNFQLL
jgi:hypothetical protein